MAKSALLEMASQVLRRKHYARKTERAYLGWIRRYILFHGKKHPRHLSGRHLEAFLTHLAVQENVAAPTHTVPVPFRGNQALSAILFLYKYVLLQPLDLDLNSVRARRPRRLPTVLSRQDVHALLVCLEGVHHLVASLLYGSGLRISECLRLRVKQVDFSQRKIVVRDGKGGKDRMTILPEAVIPSLRHQIRRAKRLHEADLKQGHGSVYLPHALERKYPDASRSWPWQWVFPSPQLSTDPRTGLRRRHHLSASGVRKAIQRAASLADLDQHVTPHTMRHSFATHLLESGYDTQQLRSGQVSERCRICSATNR